MLFLLNTLPEYEQSPSRVLPNTRVSLSGMTLQCTYYTYDGHYWQLNIWLLRLILSLVNCTHHEYWHYAVADRHLPDPCPRPGNMYVLFWGLILRLINIGLSDRMSSDCDDRSVGCTEYRDTQVTWFSFPSRTRKILHTDPTARSYSLCTEYCTPYIVVCLV